MIMQYPGPDAVVVADAAVIIGAAVADAGIRVADMVDRDAGRPGAVSSRPEESSPGDAPGRSWTRRDGHRRHGSAARWQ
jgi:hypothetical protein